MDKDLVLYMGTKALVSGYESLKWLHEHMCPTCAAGVEAMEAGKINKGNAADHVCPEALNNIKKIALADIVVEKFKLGIKHARKES